MVVLLISQSKALILQVLMHKRLAMLVMVLCLAVMMLLVKLKSALISLLQMACSRKGAGFMFALFSWLPQAAKYP